ncbi:MAG TPA: SpoIIE family protein phosphatase [Rugosimonospora sp.]|nr:SpoIIE family protein phosphatase [Rugosimonospora sp.]
MATVLVVDDDPISRDFLCTLLGYRGHQTREAADGGSALLLTAQDPPDAVITDVLMPGLDGYELARMLRSQPATSHIPIAFSTAHYGQEEIRPLARACGVQDVIFKPAHPTTVLATIDTLLGQCGPAGQGQPDAAGAVEEVIVAADDGRCIQVTGEAATEAGGQAEYLADRLAETHQLTRSGIWDLDLATGTVVVSACLRDLLHLPSTMLRPEQLWRRVHPDDILGITTMAEQTWRTGLPGTTEVRFAGMDGVVHELIVSCRATSPGRRYAERDRSVWGVAQDVTQVRQTQRAHLRAQAQWHAERRVVNMVHRALLPRTLPTVTGADLGAVYVPAPEWMDIGAGWYDAQPLDDGAVLVSVGRVAGHDQPAVAVMGPILEVLRAYAVDDPDPARLLTRLNQFLVCARGDDTFVTVVVALYEPENGHLRLANAGHRAPLVISPGCGGVPVAVSMTQRGPALGVLPDADFTGQYLTMAPGTVFCAYTDGMTTRHCDPASTGGQRLPQVAAAALGQLTANDPQARPDAQNLAERILADMHAGGPADDDICLAVLWVAGAGA